MILMPNPIPNLSESTLARFVTRARRAVRLAGQVNVLLTDNCQMLDLNRRFLKKNKPTDVLSFPSAADGAAKFAGDLAISVEIAAHNAAQLGHPLSAEIKILILHGLLHLAGYDHENHKDNGKMARQESKLRQELKLPQSLIERTENGRTPQPKPRPLRSKP